MSIGLTGISAPRAIYAVQATSSASKGASVEDDFLKHARMTPSERIRETVLKKMNLKEEDLASLSPEARKKIDEAIKQEILRLLTKGQGTIVGALADIRA